MSIRPTSEKNRGYTLIELAVVLTVISILLVFLATSIPGLINRIGGNSAEQIKSAAAFSYRYALVNHSMVILELNIDKDTFQIYSLIWSDEGLENKNLYSLSKLDDTIVSVVDARGYKRMSGIVQIPYSFDGTSENLIIHLGNDDKILQSVIIDKYHGKVKTINGEISEF